ncbi:UbiA family prenyltransferase [Arundinibacter roseus]|uniref:Ubiquinone biosynthesis protein UbiA n=1 Tax=Arundinibacter roseus TaxID=2070510 RepID=A0A4R4JYE0_9BACT|nr:UbiA family prenyltransferase [Arundinibacter roseus]TDB58659.1 ubiquinone biosynthesis protein UbiA [Arundinibacter roseus]
MKSVLLHLRIPFSVFLLPVFLFAISQAEPLLETNAWWAFWLIHLFLYPASNAYNSYYDKDEGSIGLLEKPPPVRFELLLTAWALDSAAVVLALLADLGPVFVGYLLLYGFISKAYSHPAIRLKKYPVLSWLVVGLFQGAFTYLATIQVVSGLDLSDLLNVKYLLPALITTSNLWAVYPLTQVYQHEEDAQRGDLTYSRLVGIHGTFLNAAVFFTLSFAGFLYYFLNFGNSTMLYILTVCMGPVLGYFAAWWWMVKKDLKEANFRHTMRMNVLASLGLNIFFGILCFYTL